MIEVLIQMTALIGAGIAWRILRPAGLDADTVRAALAGFVYYFLLPVLVLSVMWQAPVGVDSARIAAVAAVGVLGGLTLAWAIYRAWRLPDATTGALLLAAGFPNVLYLGLPVLETALGPWARAVAIQYDLFACTPLLLTLGILIARRYGLGRSSEHTLTGLVRVPALWALAAALGLNFGDVPVPGALAGLMDDLSGAVAPIMLIAVGMGLRLEAFRWHRLPPVVPVLVIQLLLMPALAAGLTLALGVGGGLRTAVVLEAAMPAMVLGMVIAERFRLDTGIYGVAVTASTLASFATLPLWFSLLGAAD